MLFSHVLCVVFSHVTLMKEETAENMSAPGLHRDTE